LRRKLRFREDARREMETVWFGLIALMLVAYVVLDGFDLGVGVLHLIVARTEQERRMVISTIGPVWDGNEVWLIAAGGTLFYAFPLLYASSFSGFYLALHIVLWLLVIRAVGIEFRTHLADPIWRDFFDGAFSLASFLLILFFGAALGNVMRGVPLDQNHFFFVPLWTNFRPGSTPGILDWYTVLCAAAALVALAMHGAVYLILKTEGELNRRARGALRWLWPLAAIASGVALGATLMVRPPLLENYRANPAGWLFPTFAAAGLAGIWFFLRREREHFAFLSSCCYLVAVLAGAAFGLYPNLLPATGDPAHAITIWNGAAGHKSLQIGLIWWSIGMVIAAGYFVLVYTMFRGKVRGQEYGH
jgi:cytochrome d ubiquinol oxidase subunit II